MNSIGCARVFRFLGSTLLWLAFCISAFGQGAEFDSALAPPTQEIDLSAWGFSGLSPIARFHFRANVSVHFLDNNHLLVTFVAQRKLSRRPLECLPTHPCRTIHAVILDLASSKAVTETDWYQHDYGPYLWPLSPGRFLLRKSNSLYVLDSDLHETLLKDFPSELLWANVTPDGKQIVAETVLEGSSGTASEATNRNQQTEDSRRARVKIDFLNSISLDVERSIQATGVIEFDAPSSGYADFTHSVRDNTWLVRFGPNVTQRQGVARVKSPCEPNLLFPTKNTLLVGRCSSNSRDYNVGAFSLTGHSLWRQRWPQLNHFPGLARSEDGSRFAVGTITASRETSSALKNNDEGDAGWPDVEQDVRVFETASGKLILAARVRSVVLKNPNFALAPDGNRFALLDGSVLRIFDLPSVSADERAKYLALAAGAPGLVPPTGNSSEVNGGTAAAMGDSDSENQAEAGESDLRAALRTTSTTPAAAAQTAMTDRGAASVATFNTTAKEVVVDVSVTDSKGHPVKGLSLADFQIEEDRRPQKIKYFHEFDGSAGTAASVPAPKPPPNVFSNNATPAGSQPLVAVVLDFVNTSFQDQQHAKEQLLKFLLKKPSGMQFALFLFSDGLKMLHGFTADQNRLAATVNGKESFGRMHLKATADLTRMISLAKERAALDPSVQSEVQQLVQEQAENRVNDLDRRVALTVDAFTQLARYLDGLPGRKNVVWLSGSFPRGFFAETQMNGDSPNGLSAEVRNYGEQLRKMNDLLADAHIAVYPVDVRGITNDSVYSAETSIDPRAGAAPGSQAQSQAPSGVNLGPMGGAGTNTAASIQPPSPLQRQMQEERDSRSAEQATMGDVAEATGGKAFYNTNGIQQAVEAAVEQGSSYYMFSYSSDNGSVDGKFRKLRVSHARKGYRLAYRRGYYAEPPEAPVKDTGELARAIGLHGMQHGAPESHQLVFAARVVPAGKPVKGSAAQKKVEVQHYAIDYAIAGPQLGLTPSGKMQRAILDLMVSAFNDDGSIATRTAFKTTSDLKPAAYRDMIIGGLRMHQDVDVPANAVSLRLGVLDELSRHFGSLELPLPLKAPPDEVAARARALPSIEPD